MESATVPLDEVYFPSATVCNMNTLRASFIHSLVEDETLRAIDTSFEELHKIIHLIFIAGEDYQLTEREKEIIESKRKKELGLTGECPQSTFFNGMLDNMSP